MKHTIKIVLLGLAAISNIAEAGTIDRSQQHAFNVEALRLIDNYGDFSKLRNNVDREDFRALFPEKGLSIYNDLLGLSIADSIAVDDYIKLMSDRARNASVKLKNIRKTRSWEDDDSWLMELKFEKEVLYTTSCGAILDATTYYGGDYSYTVIVAMDKESNDVHIVSLKGTTPGDRRRLPADFTFVELTAPIDSAVTANGQPLKFSHGQALVPNDASFSYFDDDANLKVHKIGDADCGHYTFSFHPMRWRVKAHADIALGTQYSMTSSPLMNNTSSSMDFGIDVGYVFPSMSKLKIGVFVGLGYSSGKINLGVDKLDYNYDAPSTADMDGDTYRRYYQLSDLKQDVKLDFINIPIYADFEYRFSKRVSAFLNLGIKAYLNAGSGVGAFSGNSYSYGVYPQYDNLMIDEGWLNNFGSQTLTPSSLDQIDIKGFSADILAGVGARVKLFGPLSLDLGVIYQMGITDVIASRHEPGTLAEGAITQNQAPVTYQVSDGTTVKNLTDYLGNVKRQSLKLNIGLVYKF